MEDKEKNKAIHKPSKNYHEVFKKIRKSKFFKDAYEGKSLGDSIKIDE